MLLVRFSVRAMAMAQGRAKAIVRFRVRAHKWIRLCLRLE
jgi:hypothetical protein